MTAAKSGSKMPTRQIKGNGCTHSTAETGCITLNYMEPQLEPATLTRLLLIEFLTSVFLSSVFTTLQYLPTTIRIECWSNGN